MPNIFVANRSYHDYSDAERFGTLKYLSDGSLKTFSISQMYRTIEVNLCTSTPEDIILISGLSVFNSLLSAYFAHLHGRLNLLVYKKGRNGPGHYVYKEIIFSKGDDQLEDCDQFDVGEGAAS